VRDNSYTLSKQGGPQISGLFCFTVCVDTRQDIDLIGGRRAVFVMNKTTKVAVLLIGLTTLPAAAADRWYMGHLGAETCVPLDNIGDYGRTRLYYGTGIWHTPADFAQVASRAGGDPDPGAEPPRRHGRLPRPDAVWSSDELRAVQ
jgi:hypothetical protein